MTKLTKTILAILLFPISLFAYESNYCCLNHRITFGPMFYHRDYSEDLTPPVKSDENGFLYGIHGSYDFVKSCSIYFGLEGEYSKGRVHYDGSLVDLMTMDVIPYKDRTTSEIVNGEVRIGYTGCALDGYFRTYFIGIGYHNWYRGRTENLIDDYSETYYWHYLALGYRHEFCLSERWDFGVYIKVMAMIEPRMEASNVNGVFNLGEEELHGEIELPLTFHLCSRQCCFDAIQLTPFARSLPIGMSNVVEDSIEPDSETYVIGLRLEVVRFF